MKEIHIKTFSEFEEAISDLNEYRAKKSQEHQTGVSELLFRGQANAAWNLTTTLERYTNDQISLPLYHRYLKRIKPAVESYTGRTWDIGSEDDFSSDHIINLPGYPMMVYVRHHGFPSPLLDWTLSPYIALFFAFSSESDSNNAAVYGFIETPEGAKANFVGSPQIIGQGPYATTHERHFTQQARYTICAEKPDEQWLYSSHESYFKTAGDHQDLLRKITIPRSIRLEILKRLDLMNINEYSLFRTEEGLMNMLAFREFTG